MNSPQAHFMADVSNPTAAGITRMPDGFEVIAGYIGGNTPHVWTAEEWHNFDGWRKLPIWTAAGRHNSQVQGEVDAQAALVALWNAGSQADGWANQASTPIALDLETDVMVPYVQGFCAVCYWARFPVWPYGSASTLRGNPAGFGYWAADWTNQEHILPWSIATQFQPAGGELAFDKSQITSAAFSRLKAW